MIAARSIRVRGIVQGVGFRPYVFRIASENALAGWVRNEEDGVEIHLEGAEPSIDAFLRELRRQPPAAARIAAIDVAGSNAAGLNEFRIVESQRNGRPSAGISPDLAVCDECLAEMRDPANRRHGYPYINCTNCGPRYSVIEKLPYDRPNTTMKRWAMDAFCRAQYEDPGDRRFHAQPIACPDCGPHYSMGIREVVSLLRAGQIVAIKGLGGYHLACDAANEAAVRALRERKFRKEKPFAVMACSAERAREVVELTVEMEALLRSVARPIVLGRAKVCLPGVAPDNDELGVMLPYTPLQHLLFDAGAPDVLVMTSANRSNEPIAYEDADARERLGGIADAFLTGERPIARRIDDSVVRVGAFGPTALRRARGYAPGAVARIPAMRPIIAVGADLKNTVTLVVNGQAFVSQHVGDLDQYEAFEAFRRTIDDLMHMYDVGWPDVHVVHDAHPQYHSTNYALELAAERTESVQHHRAHVASVLAEREAWHKRVVAASFDGTGYGEDGAIWGGEFFGGSITGGFVRRMHLRAAALAGGDAAAGHPVQCAAGFLAQIDTTPDMTSAPFQFSHPYEASLQLVRKGVRTFETTSMGRLFDAAAALIGFTREITFEGQAAMYLEYLANRAANCDAYPFPIVGEQLDFRPLLEAVMSDRVKGREAEEIARAFHAGVAHAVCEALLGLCENEATDTVVLSGGVFQNELLLGMLKSLLRDEPVAVWTNSSVPPNDGGISLGQAAIAALGPSRA